MSNILFVLYHDFSANSAVHVHNFANQLAGSGHSVAVAIPGGDDTGSALGEQHYSVLAYHEVDGNWARVFSNGLPPGILHAWTPRENVRLFCEKVRAMCSPLLFIHLEDNEELILEANLGTSFAEIERSRTIKLPGNLAHPRNYRRFIAEANGVTMIMDRLEKFVPPALPRLILWPGADRQLFFARKKDETFLASLGVPLENIVLCYTGNVHSANAREVRSLYLAAAILSREGIPTTLVRAGKDYCPFLGPDEKWAREVSVDLGYVKHVDIPRVLGLADFLVPARHRRCLQRVSASGEAAGVFRHGTSRAPATDECGTLCSPWARGMGLAEDGRAGHRRYAQDASSRRRVNVAAFRGRSRFLPGAL